MPQHPPSDLKAVCGFTITGSTRHHLWPPFAYYGLKSCSGTRLRVRLRRCWVCDAFQLTSLGGNSDVVDELLEFARPMPEVVGWISHEQPGHEHVREQLPAPR
jgi:hypothetical protein